MGIKDRIQAVNDHPFFGITSGMASIFGIGLITLIVFIYHFFDQNPKDRLKYQNIPYS